MFIQKLLFNFFKYIFYVFSFFFFNNIQNVISLKKIKNTCLHIGKNEWRCSVFRINVDQVICVHSVNEKKIRMYRVKKQNLQLITYRGIQNVLKTRCVTNLKLRNTYIYIHRFGYRLKGHCHNIYTVTG